MRLGGGKTVRNLDATNEWRFSEKAVRLEPRLSVNSADAAIAAVEAGIGITRALSYQVEPRFAGRLVPILRSFAPPPSPVSAVYPGAQDRVGERGGFRQSGARSLQGQPCRSPGRMGDAARGLSRKQPLGPPLDDRDLIFKSGTPGPGSGFIRLLEGVS